MEALARLVKDVRFHPTDTSEGCVPVCACGCVCLRVYVCVSIGVCAYVEDDHLNRVGEENERIFFRLYLRMFEGEIKDAQRERVT